MQCRQPAIVIGQASNGGARDRKACCGEYPTRGATGVRGAVPICATATVSTWLVRPAAASTGAYDRQAGQDLDVAGTPRDSRDTLRCEHSCNTAPVCATSNASARNTPSLAACRRQGRNWAWAIMRV